MKSSALYAVQAVMLGAQPIPNTEESVAIDKHLIANTYTKIKDIYSIIFKQHITRIYLLLHYMAFLRNATLGLGRARAKIT